MLLKIILVMSCLATKLVNKTNDDNKKWNFSVVNAESKTDKKYCDQYFDEDNNYSLPITGNLNETKSFLITSAIKFILKFNKLYISKQPILLENFFSKRQMNLLERVVRIDESRSNINNMNDNNDESSRDGQNAKKGNLTIENKLSNLFEKIDKRENINDLNYFENTLTTGEDGKITIALLKKISENGTLGIYEENETVLQNLKIVLKTIDLDKLIKLGFLKNGLDFEENIFDLLEDLQID